MPFVRNALYCSGGAVWAASAATDSVGIGFACGTHDAPQPTSMNTGNETMPLRTEFGTSMMLPRVANLSFCLLLACSSGGTSSSSGGGSGSGETATSSSSSNSGSSGAELTLCRNDCITAVNSCTQFNCKAGDAFCYGTCYRKDLFCKQECDTRYRTDLTTCRNDCIDFLNSCNLYGCTVGDKECSQSCTDVDLNCKQGCATRYP